MEPKVVFEDIDLLVIDKPSGMIVNKADTTRGERTVQEWVEEKLEVRSDLPADKAGKSEVDRESDFVKRAGIVHRLDKETSGILLTAKNPESFENLQKQFKERTVKKKYLALVHGKVEPSEGEIRVPVGRLPWNRERFGVIPGGRESATKYKALSSYKLDVSSYTLLELAPLTGRTHQIRVHLKYLGFPIVGDQLYAGRKQSREDRKWCSRLFLHASEIRFSHPKTGEQITLQSELPNDLEHALAKLAARS